MANTKGFANTASLTKVGLSSDQLAASVAGTYRLLDRIDQTLTADGVEPLCQIVELANLSSMIGNVLGAEVAKASNGMYVRNGPHKFPDLVPAHPNAAKSGIEIKMALNRNNPKGHLAKEGNYLTCRYVLIDADESPCTEKADRHKAQRAVIWEMRAGYLTEDHFNISNTAGDSGKTAVVNASGMEALKVVYVDLDMVPGSRNGANYRAYAALLE
ncbi:hypothetical protein [Sphingomonas sp. Y38-1Y]|uniref:hypothetical protein n=1 Tax=Sphingomonas sp. Y38-1Y TaxID=3078265 RepID=UPI0028E8FC86|nr:hypothetical protein [Sphingomonas sp. Y38-1Y]